MKCVRFGMAFMLIVLMSACTMKQTVPLPGKWQNLSTGRIIEFTSDGVMLSTEDGKTNRVGYRLMDNKRVQFFVGDMTMGVVELRVERDRLTLVDSEGHKHHYEKIR